MSLGYGLVAYAIAMATGKKGLAIAVASVYAFGSFIFTSLAPAVKALQPFEKISLFYYYNHQPVMQFGFHIVNLFVMIGFVLVLSFVSLQLFRSRDLN
jgi:ABC-2 type transport system permease protein